MPGSAPQPPGLTHWPTRPDTSGSRENGQSATTTPTATYATTSAGPCPTHSNPTRYLYLAHPIDRCSGPNLWVGEAILLLRKRGWVIYDPARAWQVPFERDPDGGLQEINRTVLRGCDAVLALLPDGMASFGVPAECEYARSLGMPVAVVGAAGSWAMASFRCFREPLGAISWLCEQPPRPRGPEPVLRVSGDGKAPTRAYPDDAGLDLYVCGGPHTINPGQFLDVDCGVHIELPPGTWGLITGRSSTLRRLGLLVAQGVIDGGYRGRLFAGCWNLGEEAVTVEDGDRLAQLIIHHNATEQIRVERAEVLSDGTRGSKGFGSSGQ